MKQLFGHVRRSKTQSKTAIFAWEVDADRKSTHLAV